jgi:hypothetical protein
MRLFAVATTTRRHGRQCSPSIGIAESLAFTLVSGSTYVSFTLDTAVNHSLTQIVRDVCGTAFWFVAYESMKQEISYMRGQKSTDDISVAAAGFLSGCISLLLVRFLVLYFSLYSKN